MIADTENTIIRPTEGRFRCPFCTDDELVDADTEHEHDGLCGDREWVDELPGFSATLSTPANELPAEVLPPEDLDWLSDLPDDVLLVDVLIEFGLADRLEDDDGWWPTCPCCGRRGQLIVPLVELAA